MRRYKNGPICAPIPQILLMIYSRHNILSTNRKRLPLQRRHIKIKDPANRIKISAMTLSSVDQNDSALTELRVINRGCLNPTSKACCSCPNDSVNLARLGAALGPNKNLQKLITKVHELVDIASNKGAFVDGLIRNISINELYLTRCHFSEGLGHDILNGFMTNLNSSVLLCARH